MSQPILVLNCGSSSIKFALFDAAIEPLPRKPLWSGRVEDIGGTNARLVAGADGVAVPLDKQAPYQSALRFVRASVEQQTGGQLPAAIVHRVVHGGSKYTAPVRVDARVLDDLKSYIPLAPLHQPFALQAVEVMLAEAPELPQIACFDTAFHRTLPEVEQLLPLPYAQWERGVRRYGFHGLSYEYLTIALPERHGDAARGRTIVAHLGSGASLCAMHGLKSVATTMGFSALDGLMMGTRCGSLDPGVVLHLLEVQKLGVDRVAHLLYHESGLVGVSGMSSSPKELLEVERDNPRARAALALYVRRTGTRRAHRGARRTRDARIHRRRRRAQRGAPRPHLRGTGMAGRRYRCRREPRGRIAHFQSRESRSGCRGADERGMDGGTPCRPRASRGRSGREGFDACLLPGDMRRVRCP